MSRYKAGNKVVINKTKLPDEAGEQLGGYVSGMEAWKDVQGIVNEVRELGEAYIYKIRAIDEDSDLAEFWWDERCLLPLIIEEVKEKNAPLFKIMFKKGVLHYAKSKLKTQQDTDARKALLAYINCILPPEAQRAIDESITIALNAHIFELWGVTENFEKGIGNTILLYGAPGVGKTMIAEGLAAVLGKPLLVLTNAQLQSNIPGQMERNITEAFSAAAENSAVVVLDECDSLLYDRDCVGAIMSAEINHLLGAIERFNGVVILTTNRLHKLDSALERRILCKVCIPRPDEKSREAIWIALIPAKLPTDKLDYKKLAAFDLSGGQIKNAILVAIRRTVGAGREVVKMRDLISAAQEAENSQQAFNAGRDRELIPQEKRRAEKNQVTIS